MSRRRAKREREHRSARRREEDRPENRALIEGPHGFGTLPFEVAEDAQGLDKAGTLRSSSIARAAERALAARPEGDKADEAHPTLPGRREALRGSQTDQGDPPHPADEEQA